MTSQPVESVMTETFLAAAMTTLQADGFVTDEHDFAPYRETICTHVEQIQKALIERGFEGELTPGFLKHPQAGYAYYIYDTTHFDSRSMAEKSIDHWLTQQYGE